MSDQAILELLNAFAKRLDEDLGLVRKLSEMSDDARATLGLSLDPTIRAEERIRAKVLEALAGEVATIVGKISAITGGCDAWLEINGGRIACELGKCHEGSHSKKLVGRVEKERIDATITWVMAPYIKAV